MKRILIPAIILLFAFAANAQDQYVKKYTFSSNTWIYNSVLGYRNILEIDKAKGEINVYGMWDYSKLVSAQLPIPSGYVFDSLMFHGYNVDTSKGAEYAFIAKSGSKTKGIICTRSGKLLKTIDDAVSMRAFKVADEYKIMVEVLKSGVTTTSVYTYGPDFDFENQYPTADLNCRAVRRHSEDKGYVNYYYVDVSNKKLKVFNYNHKGLYDLSISVPSGSTLLPKSTLLHDNTLNNEGLTEFGVYFKNGSNYSAKIINSSFELQSYSGVVGMKVYVFGPDRILALKHFSAGKPKWDMHKIDNSKTTSTTSFLARHAGEPLFSEYYGRGVVFDRDSMAMFSYYHLNKGYLQTVYTGLKSTDEIITWGAYYQGVGDANSDNQEAYYLWKSNTGKYTFNVKRHDGTTLLHVDNARAYKSGAIINSQKSNIILSVPGKGSELYEYDFHIIRPKTIYPAHKQKQVPFKNLTFSWTKAEKTERYTLELYVDTTTSTGRKSFEVRGDTTLTLTYDLDSATTYYWHVKARNEYISTNPRYFSRFRTTDAGDLKAPIHISPNDNAVDQDISVTLNWSKVDFADSYEFQYSKTSDFSTSAQGVVTGTSKVLTPLDYSTQYFWRVRSKKGATVSNWSSEWSFTTKSKSSIQAPILTSPANLSINLSTSPNLTWQTVTGVDGYTYEYATKLDFTDATSTSTANTSAGLTGLSIETTYYWRVKAEKSGDFSGWSNVWSFTTVKAGIPAKPTLLTPANKATDVNPASATLTWNAADNAATYEAQLSTDLNFATFSTGTPTGTTIVFADLKEETTYYWRVKAINGANESDWSDIWIFTTDKTIGIDRDLSSDWFSIYPNPTNGTVFIELANLNGQSANIEMIDQTGKVVFTKKAHQSITELDITLYNEGLYFFRVVGLHETAIYRIIKQ